MAPVVKSDNENVSVEGLCINCVITLDKILQSYPDLKSLNLQLEKVFII